ncbi:MAG TPA: hypothetical protein VHL77_07295 [Ferruginibacter sp.]|jgi:hypothetical protein|nr:hypothetical protein [Ferruginibacter sp.]
MTAGWKIFKLANIVEILIVSTLIAVGMITSPLPVETFEDKFAFVFVCSIPVFTTINCIHNILLADNQNSGKHLSIGKRVFFWVFFVVFVGIMILALIGLYGILESFRAAMGYNRLNLRQKFITFSILTFLLNGIYILIAQVRLFVHTGKKYKQGNLLIIEEIGSGDTD